MTDTENFINHSILELKDHLELPTTDDWTEQEDTILRLADLIRAERILEE